MLESPNILLTILSFVVVLAPLVFIHELGHYAAGRYFGVKVEVFSIGFGRQVFGWTDSVGTRWKVGWMPLGGYVRFAGDMGASSQPDPAVAGLPAHERARTFQAKPLWQRAIIVFAGPLANFLLAIAIFSAFFSIYGEPRTPPVVASVMEGSAAEKAGILPGDRVTAIDGSAVTRFEDISAIVSIHPGDPVRIDIERNGDRIVMTVIPTAVHQRDRFGNEFKRGMLGISHAGRVVEELPLTQVLPAAVRHTRDIVVMMVDTLGQVITGRRSTEELGGPLKIAQYSGQQATLGLAALVEFMAMISINLGFINLLPIPMLDGGHLLFYGIEAVRRRPVHPDVQAWAFRSGLALLMGLMLFVTFNDLGAFGMWDHLAGLIRRS